MKHPHEHTFHIPVMGLGYTIDTPVKVARFGISSVVSIIQDELVEQMREFHCGASGEEYVPIRADDPDHRAKRITAYLNLLQRIVDKQVHRIRSEPFGKGKEITKYFVLLPDHSPLKKLYLDMAESTGKAKEFLQQKLRDTIKAGSIDVNIMASADNPNYSKTGEPLPEPYNDAMAALRGFAESNLSSSCIFSAGFNPRLYSYAETFPDFFPDRNGHLKKKIILKVSDYRSALIQGKFLAGKGLFVSEFRVESGLNCGGHAFPTNGKLLGPVLEEFRVNRHHLNTMLLDLCNKALQAKHHHLLSPDVTASLSVQGGIGTANEDAFLRNHYDIDTTGWGSPFLLVPEATNVDEDTLQSLARAKKEDYYLSHASPLGIPFNNFRKSTSEKQRKTRIGKNRPGSPCYLRHLRFNTEFTESPVCLSSREYQHLKLQELAKMELTKKEFREAFDLITEKDCLCHGLSASVLIRNKLPLPHKLNAVAICPGPNLAYFSSIFSLKKMVDHIYGRTNILNSLPRAHMFVNELKMYVEYFKNELLKKYHSASLQQKGYFVTFRSNLLNGIEYYKQLALQMPNDPSESKNKIKEEMEMIRESLLAFCMGPLFKNVFEKI